MDEILKDITNIKPVRSDAKSLARFAAKILSFANNMEQNGCSVTDSAEAPFIMSQLLSKLDGADNVEFGREMVRAHKVENIKNLIAWLNNEATLRSRSGRSNFDSRPENHGIEVPNRDEICPLGCNSKHLLTACPLYQAASVNERWEIVRKHKRCCKCLRSITQIAAQSPMVRPAVSVNEDIINHYTMTVMGITIKYPRILNSMTQKHT